MFFYLNSSSNKLSAATPTKEKAFPQSGRAFFIQSIAGSK
jgi:hypothetical protein